MHSIYSTEHEQRIPRDRALIAEEVDTLIEDGAVQFDHVNLTYINAVPCVQFKVFDEALIRISPTVNMLLDQSNPNAFHFTLAIRVAAPAGSEIPSREFLLNVVELAINSGLFNFSVFSDEEGNLPSMVTQLDPNTWQETGKREDGNSMFTLFGFTSILQPARKQVLSHASHQVMLGQTLAQAIDAGEIGSSKPDSNIATQIMSGKLH